MRITQILLRRPVAVTVVTIAVLFMGIFSLKKPGRGLSARDHLSHDQNSCLVAGVNPGRD